MSILQIEAIALLCFGVFMLFGATSERASFEQTFLRRASGVGVIVVAVGLLALPRLKAMGFLN